MKFKCETKIQTNICTFLPHEYGFLCKNFYTTFKSFFIGNKLVR